MSLQYTPIAELDSIYETLQKTFRDGLARPLEWRKHQLYQLARMAQDNSDAFVASMHADLGKPAMESILGEIGPLVERSIISAQSLDEWARSEPVPVPEWQRPWAPTLHKTPKGVVLIIAPWNYPMILSLQPLMGAIAAGCPAVIKPSEVCPTYSSLLASLLPKYLDQSAYRVVNGSVPEVSHLLKLKWDHIFYTGNGSVARIVSAAAAKHLTPVTLELGGKSPVLVDANCDLKLAAKRAFFGKTTNAGQICICPDYAILPRSAKDEFVAALQDAYDTFYPEGALKSESFGSIVSKLHYDRLLDLQKRTRAKAVIGGKTDGRNRIEPTVYVDVEDDDSLMEGEIFGPLFPIVLVDDINEGIELINKRPHPLVLYAFTNDPKVKQALIDRTRSGTLIFNDTIQQLSGKRILLNEIPFTGIGESGQGYQILKYTYDGFTHLRASIDIPAESEPILSPRYAPYTPENIKLLTDATLNQPIPKSVYPKAEQNGKARY